MRKHGYCRLGHDHQTLIHSYPKQCKYEKSNQLLLCHNDTIYIKVRKKAKIKNRYNQISHLTKHTIRESDKNTRKNHMQVSQEVSPFPAGCKVQTRQQDRHETQIKKRSTKEVPPLKGQYLFLLEALYMFYGTNLTLISDVDQDKYTFFQYF